MMILYKGYRIFAFSDTHGLHEKVAVPSGTDILICAGDVESDSCCLASFLSWYAAIPAQLHLFTPGNHDLSFDLDEVLARRCIPCNVILLQNGRLVFEELVFHSADARPWLFGFADIPDDVDILIIHGAPCDCLDNGKGCRYLADAILRHRPKIHLFGHIHECGNKSLMASGIAFHNVSLYQELVKDL
ncbi:MAG: hypothetical protein Q4C43_09715 [Prevotella sp.]|nr:hypothetical protein [Prevotella sp.]